MKNAPIKPAIQKKIVNIEDADKWMVDNKYLRSGYRQNFAQISDILKSTFMKHNELLNIWTHLIGAIIFIGIFIYLTQNQHFGSFKLKNIPASLADFSGKTEKFFKHYNTEIKDVLNHINWENTKELLSRSQDTLSDLQSDINTLSSTLKRKFKKGESTTLKQVDSILLSLSDHFDHLQKNVNEKYQQLLSKKDQWTDIQYKEILSSSLSKIASALDQITPEAETINKIMSVFHQKLEIYPFFIYTATVIFCLMSSAIYHTFFPMSQTINKILHKFDMAGISILVFGSFFALFYYYLYCMPGLRNFYCTFIFINSLVVFSFAITDWINKEENLKWKALIFGSFALSGAVPMTHIVALSFQASQENDHMPADKCFLYFLLMACMYLGGLAIYASRVPERFYPKVFDIWFNSHTIWHVIVFFAALLHFYNLCLIYKLRLTKPCHYR